MYLIDANNLIHKAFYKSNNNFPLFMRIFNMILYSIVKNDYYSRESLLIFDSPFAYWRKEIYKQYKGTRKVMNDYEIFCEFRQKLIKYYSNNTNRHLVCLPNLEADDIIAYFVNKFKLSKKVIIIVSSDTDMYQLLNKSPIVLIRKIGNNYYNYNSFVKEFGFIPQLYSSYKALAGDRSDNIPGVNGIGPMWSVKIIQKFGHIDNWLENIQPTDGDRVSKLAFQARLMAKKVRLYYKLIDLSENHSGIAVDFKNNLYK